MKFAALLPLALAATTLHGQNFPQPTPPMQAVIDKDISRHFGDAPADPGPIANLSPALEPHAIDAAIHKVADWQLTRSEPYFDRIWTWSVLYSGFLAASDATGDPRYRAAMVAMSDKYAWAPRSKMPNADDQSVGQTYLDLVLAAGGKPDPAHVQPIQTALDSVIGLDTLTPTDPRIPWWWCDALFMAPPVWARMYAVSGDHKYIEYLDKNWQKTSDLLYDKQEHLYARDATYIPKREANGKKIFWSRGEGWVMGGLARTLDYLPKDDPSRAFYTTQLREMSERVAQLQGADGLWHAGLLDPEHYPLPEISGSCLMTFGMAWGVNHGVLDARTYRPIIAKAWAGILKHVYADGRLGDIQQTGAEPAFYTPGSSYTYGVGGFLLAAREIRTMSQTKPTGNEKHTRHPGQN
jgi:rhamnogalacturonyl hydrolase YesR